MLSFHGRLLVVEDTVCFKSKQLTLIKIPSFYEFSDFVNLKQCKFECFYDENWSCCIPTLKLMCLFVLTNSSLNIKNVQQKKKYNPHFVLDRNIQIKPKIVVIFV